MEIEGTTRSRVELLSGQFPNEGTPVSGATVTMFKDIGRDGQPESDSRTITTETDEQGNYSTGEITQSSRTRGLRITHPDFQPVYVRFVEESDFFIVLARRLGRE